MCKQKQTLMLKIITVFLIGLTLLSFVKAIWISLDIDESYAVALGYRLARGDRLIRDMWEPHQFSALLTALFAAPYIRIRGNTDYLVIYLRLAGIVLHTLLGLALYRRLAQSGSRFFTFFITILHLNYLPKWIQSPEFELIHYWCLLGIFLVLHAYFTGRKHSPLLLLTAGCLLAGSVLCYPTMLLLYPFYLLAVSLLEKQYLHSNGKQIFTKCLFFTLGAALTGILFLIWIFSYLSPDKFLRYLSYILMDTSHTVYTMQEKWTMYLDQIQVQFGLYISCLLPAAGLMSAVYLLYRLVSRKKGSSPARPIFALHHIGFLSLSILLATGLLMQLKGIRGFLFEDENQLFFQVRYIAILLPAVLIGIRYYKEMALWLHLCIFPGILSVIAVLFVTNMDTNVTYAKAFLGVLGSFLLFYQYSTRIVTDPFRKKLFSFLQFATGSMVLTGFLICRLLLIRVTGCLPVTILAPLEKMTSGPEKGLCLLKDTAEIWNDNYCELDAYVSKEDSVLYIGSENLIYVKLQALPATPSTQGTVVYNEMFLYYYREHPERLPNVILFDKSFSENPVYTQSYSFSLQDGSLFAWLKENYGDGKIAETEHLIILRKE